jgi:hypothetical protein
LDLHQLLWYQLLLTGNNEQVCRKIAVTPSAFNATYQTGFFLIPKSANQSNLAINLGTKYKNVGVGIGLGNGHIDMDLLYQDVSAAHSCVDYYHFKPGTEKYHECWNALS